MERNERLVVGPEQRAASMADKEAYAVWNTTGDYNAFSKAWVETYEKLFAKYEAESLAAMRRR